MDDITFEKASNHHEAMIFSWLEEEHVKEFWDNSQEHKDDLLNFINGHKQYSFYGTMQYWIGLINGDPYCFLLSDILQPEQNLPDLHRKHLSRTGHTIALDFTIGNKDHLGKGLAALTLERFIKFYNESIDHLADCFFIDPDDNNPRAIHVYEKADFKRVGSFDVEQGTFKGNVNYLMVKNLSDISIDVEERQNI